MVRWSERALGLAIRKGQDAGKIRVQGQNGSGLNQHVTVAQHRDERLSASDYFSHDQERSDVYAITNGVSDAQFDQALAEAKEEGNLSRANVMR